MSINRQFEIVYILINKKTVKADELAQHFEVSKRTILRDIEKLSVSGIPVYTEQGRGGGISLMEDFVLNKSLLSEEEKNHVLMSLQTMNATGLQKKNVLSKFKSLFGENGTEWIKVDFSRWGSGAEDNEKFNIIKDSIIKNKTIEFDYINSAKSEKMRRKVNPLILVFKSKAWYLQGYCLIKEDYRMFKLNRIINLNQSNSFFRKDEYEPPLIEDPQNHYSSVMNVTLRFRPEAAYRIYDEFDMNNFEETEEGYLDGIVRLPVDDWLYGYLMSFGDKVKVIEPKEVADELKKRHMNSIKDTQ